MRFFIELSYRGTGYCGWQRQPDAPSVQGALEDALSTLLRTPTPVTGAGRTDTGVHASAAVAHFDATTEPDIYHLNALLPRDIAVRRVRQVADGAHARFDATERAYTYYIIGEKDPFRQDTAWFFRGSLDVAAMNAAAAYLLGTQEFTTFSKLHSANKTDICTVFEASFRSSGIPRNALLPPSAIPTRGTSRGISSSEPKAGAERWPISSPASQVVGSLPHSGELHFADAPLRSCSAAHPDTPLPLCHPEASVSESRDLIFTIKADRFLRNMVRAIVGTLVDVGRGKMTPEQFAAALKARDRRLSASSAPAQGLFLTGVRY